MANWTDYVANAGSLTSIYGCEVPALHCVDFHGLETRRDGPSVLLRFDLADYPHSPPRKWVDAKFNRVQLRLLAIGVNEFKMAGLKSNCSLSIEILKENGSFRILGSDDEFLLEIAARHILIDGINAYRSE